MRIASQRTPPPDPRLEENGHAPHLTDGYVEMPATAALADVCPCTWIDATIGPRHPVLPDACIDIIWDGTDVFVAGPDTGPRAVVSPGTFVGLRFRPGSAANLLGVAASELRDRSVRLVEMWGAAALQLTEMLMERPQEAIELLQWAVLERRRDAQPVDPVVEGILLALQGRPTGPVVPLLLDELAVSERTLRRHCLAAFGYGPKTLERIFRFRRAVRLLRDGASPAAVAQLAGYADQAHLGFEFARLAGCSPGRLASRPDLVLSWNGCDSATPGLPAASLAGRTPAGLCPQDGC